MLDHFIVTHLDLEAGHGYVRQLSSRNNMIPTRPIRFDVNRPAEIIYDEDGFGYSMPSPETLARLPEIDMQLVGSIAFETEPWRMALIEDLPFLRNWGYADQCDAAEKEIGDSDDFGTDADAENDYDSTSAVYSRAYSHFGNHEMAREATEMYPGDFM